MAIKATVHKLELAVADLDRGHYADYTYTLARHPSETERRLMVRVLGAALFSHEDLVFGRGLCVDDEADLWQLRLDGGIVRWIDVGEPDEKWIRKACARADEVVVLSFGRAAPIWWRGIADRLQRFAHLKVFNIESDQAAEVAVLSDRGMRLQCTIQDGQVWLTDGQKSVCVTPTQWAASGGL